MYRGTPTQAATGLPEPDPLHNPGSTIEVILLESGTEFAVVTYGSSSCPVVSTDSDVLSPNHIAISAIDTYADPRSDTCTDDLSPMTHVFDLPPDVDSGEPLTVTILGRDLRLPLAGTSE